MDRQDDDTPTVDEAENGPDGHLTEPWVVGVAVAFCTSLKISRWPFFPSSSALAIIIAGVAAIVIFLKLRQRRRRRQQQNDLTRSDPLNPRPSREQTWKGPYTSRASYTRSPSPVSPSAPTFAYWCAIIADAPALASLQRRIFARRSEALGVDRGPLEPLSPRVDVRLYRCTRAFPSDFLHPRPPLTYAAFSTQSSGAAHTR